MGGPPPPGGARGAGLEIDGCGDHVHVLRDVTVSGNSVSRFSGYGISVGNSTDTIRLTDNAIHQTNASGIIVQQRALRTTIGSNLLSAVALGATTGSGIQVSGGTFESLDISGNTLEGLPAGKWHISLESTSGATIQDNRMHGTRTFAITAVSSHRLSVLGNVAENPATHLDQGDVEKQSGNSWDGERSAPP